MTTIERKIPLWAYAFLGLVYFVLASFIVAHVQSPIDGAGTKMADNDRVVIFVKHNSPADAAGLVTGDIIKMIGPYHVSGIYHMDMLDKFRSGQTVPYLIERNGELVTIEITLSSVWAQNQWFYVSFYLLILMVCSTSLIILYRKPYDISARIFFIFLQLFALAQNFNVIYADNTFVIIGSIFFILSFNIFGVVLLHFHLLFPKPVSFFRKIRVYLYALYSTGILLGLIMIISFLRHFLIGTEASVMFNNTVIRWSTTWMAFTLLLALVFAFYQFIVEKNSNTKKQLQLVVIGSVFGLITPILYGISPGFIWRIEHEKQIMNMLELTSGIGTYIMTSFLAVAIFRYRLWNVEIVVRKAILYFSATAIIIFCYLLLLHLVNILMIDKTNVTQFIALAASVVVFLLLRDILQRYIDRLFYRESYNSTKMVKEFEEKYAGIYKLDELSKTATESLSDLFHCKSIIMALHKNHQIYSVAHYLGLQPEYIVKDFTITKEADFYLQNERIFSIEEISEKPKLFKYCQGELVIPMIRDGKPFGMIIMGAKLSERSYSLQDIELLSVLSKRIVSLFKTAELYERDLNRHLLLEEERIRIAKDIHDEVGAKLTRISIMSDAAKIKNRDTSKTFKWLQSIAETSREVTQDMTQIIWALSPKDNTMEGLIAYLRRYTIEYLEPTNMKCRFNVPENLDEIHLRPIIRRNVYLCIKEALNNIIKHAGASNVIVTVFADQHWFKILVKDNGSGFEICKKRLHGNGLANINNRMLSIGGKVITRSRKGEGTEVTLLIPAYD